MGGNTRTKQPNKTHPLNGRTKQNTEQFKNSAEQNTKPKTRPERFETRTPERSEHRTAFANTRTLFCPSPDDVTRRRSTSYEVVRHRTPSYDVTTRMNDLEPTDPRRGTTEDIN